jgi:hypothetical protein
VRLNPFPCGSFFRPYRYDVVAGPVEQHPTKPVEDCEPVTETGPAMTVWRCQRPSCGHTWRQFGWVHVT